MPTPQIVKDGPVSQGTRESISWSVDFAPSASILNASYALLSGGSDVTACHITGAASIVGTVVRLPGCCALEFSKSPYTILIGARVDGNRRWVQNEIQVFNQG